MTIWRETDWRLTTLILPTSSHRIVPSHDDHDNDVTYDDHNHGVTVEFVTTDSTITLYSKHIHLQLKSFPTEGQNSNLIKRQN